MSLGNNDRAGGRPAHARVLPLVFDNESPELDGRWFDIHLHAAMYYHVAENGSFGPYFFSMASQPISYRAGAQPPAPGEYTPEMFSWERHAPAYDFLVVRNPPAGFLTDALEHGAELVATSGPWELFRIRGR